MLDRAELDQLSETDVATRISPSELKAALASPPFIKAPILNLRTVLPGIYRSAALTSDADEWVSANVKRVYDLRWPKENAAAPDPIVAGVENVYLPPTGSMSRDDGFMKSWAEGDGTPGWTKAFLFFMDVYKPSYTAVLEHIRDQPNIPILFHCTAGRDRTGLLAGLIQRLAGSSLDDVVSDYMLSRIGIETGRDKLFALLSRDRTANFEDPAVRNLASIRPQYWRALEETVKEKWGGWEGYVTKELGFSDADLEKIKDNLRAKSKANDV